MANTLRLGWLTLALWLLTPFWVAAQTEPPDVGLLTHLAGEVAFRGGKDEKNTVPAQPFMKVRLGDHLDLAGESSIQLLFFVNGRQETWKGPVLLTVGEVESRAGGQCQPPPQPEVKFLPAKATTRMAVTSLPLPNSSIQSFGGIQTMAPQKKTQATKTSMEEGSESPGPDGMKELDAARKTYRDLRKTSPANDLTPDLYLLGVLADHRQFREMEGIVNVMLEKRPGDSTLHDLKAWILSQSASREHAAPEVRKK